MAFDVPRKGRTCACCGETIIHRDDDNQRYRRLHFTLANTTAVAPISFCVDCAEQPWTAERVAQLNQQCQWMHHAHPPIQFELPDVIGVDSSYPPQTWAEVGALKVAL